MGLLVAHRPGRIPRDDDDDDNNAFPCEREMLDAAPPASGLRRPELSMRLRPHLGHCAQGSMTPYSDQSIASYVRPLLCVCARWTPESRSRFSVDGGKSGAPGSSAFLLAGVIPRDNSRRMLGSAGSRIRELISFPSVHCEIVHGVGSFYRPASSGSTLWPARSSTWGVEPIPRGEISFEGSCPTYLRCMLGLMSAEQIRQGLK